MGFGGFGMGEMIFIFLIVLLLFGAKRLPEIGSSLGKGIREFKNSVSDIERELKIPDQRQQIQRPKLTTDAQAKREQAVVEDDDDGGPRSLSQQRSEPAPSETPSEAPSETPSQSS